MCLKDYLKKKEEYFFTGAFGIIEEDRGIFAIYFLKFYFIDC